MKLLDVILWSLYSILEGIADGVVFSMITSDDRKFPFLGFRLDIHWFFNATRIVALAACIILGLKLSGTNDPLHLVASRLIAFMLMFSMLHNSAYYLTRKYPIWYTSDTTTAKNSFTFAERVMMFAVGVVFYFVSFYS